MICTMVFEQFHIKFKEIYSDVISISKQLQIMGSKEQWRKIKRRIWKIPPRTHNNLVCNITNNIDAMIDKRMVRFIYNSISLAIKLSQIYYE